MSFHSHVSDDSAQNSATRFEHMKKIVKFMYENNLFIKYGTIYNTTYGCSKQNRCENVMWILSVLVFTYIVILDT